MKNLWKKFSHGLRQWRMWGVILSASGLLLLSGCVKYDLEINFASQTHGEIVQHIQIGERLTAFSNETAKLWLESIKRRARQLQGKTKQVSDQEVVVTIPFNNGSELADKINQFMNPVEQKPLKSKQESDLGMPEISSQMTVTQNNWLLVLRNRLVYDLDLRSLGVISADGNLLISPGALLDLKFALRTPWGAKIIADDSPGSIDQSATEINPTPAMTPEIRDRGRTLVWSLQPGQVNHIEVIFWVPSPIGIGAAILAVFIGLSMYVKNLWSPDDDADDAQTATAAEISTSKTAATETEATPVGQ